MGWSGWLKMNTLEKHISQLDIQDKCGLLEWHKGRSRDNFVDYDATEISEACCLLCYSKFFHLQEVLYEFGDL